MKIRLAGPILSDSIVDGAGLRSVIFTQGCKHHCPGCQNSQTWDFQGGIETTTEDVVQKITKNSFNTGITFSGGDPLEQPEACLDIVLKLKKLGYKDFWAYTGYRFEDIRKNKAQWNFVQQINILVDGPFIERYKSYDLQYKGSGNQRIINMKESIKLGILVYGYKNLAKKSQTEEQKIG